MSGLFVQVETVEKMAKSESNEQVSFQNLLSEVSHTMSDGLMCFFEYFRYRGSLPFGTDSENEEVLQELLETISSLSNKVCQAYEKFPSRLFLETDMDLGLVHSLLLCGLRFVKWAKNKGNTEKAKGYLCDTYRALYYPISSLRVSVELLSKAAAPSQNKSASQKKEKQEGKSWQESKYLAMWSQDIDSILSSITGFGLSDEGNRKDRKDFAAMEEMLGLEHGLCRALDRAEVVKTKTSSPLVKEVKVILRLLLEDVVDFDDTWLMREGIIPDLSVTDVVGSVFARANEHCSKIKELIIRLEMASEEALSSLGKAGASTTEQEDEAGGKKKIPQWKPPKGYIGSKTIVNDYKVPRTTLQGWAERDSANVKKDLQTKENYYRETWLKKRLKSYKHRKNASQ